MTNEAATQIIDLKFRGVCIDGPWKGQQLNAEYEIVPIDKLRMGLGSYSHTRGGWVWEKAART